MNTSKYPAEKRHFLKRLLRRPDVVALRRAAEAERKKLEEVVSKRNNRIAQQDVLIEALRAALLATGVWRESWADLGVKKP